MGAHAFGALAFAAGAMFFSSSTAIAAATVGDRCGKATWFDGDGGLTASGELNRAGTLTAAHRNLPFGTEVRVDNLANGHSVVVRINDRGSFKGSRIISVSRAAAEELGMIEDGVAKVRLSVDGEDQPAGDACGGELTVASAEGDVDETAAIAEKVPAVTILPPATVAISDGSTTSEDTTIEPAISDEPTITDGAMTERFAAAFEPESWEESELRKLIEALLPRYWRRGSGLAPSGARAAAAASVAIPWPALDGFTQVSLSRDYVADLWSPELADPASARFERAGGATAVSLLTE